MLVIVNTSGRSSPVGVHTHFLDSRRRYRRNSGLEVVDDIIQDPKSKLSLNGACNMWGGQYSPFVVAAVTVDAPSFQFQPDSFRTI